MLRGLLPHGRWCLRVWVSSGLPRLLFCFIFWKGWLRWWLGFGVAMLSWGPYFRGFLEVVVRAASLCQESARWRSAAQGAPRAGATAEPGEHPFAGRLSVRRKWECFGWCPLRAG